MKALITIDGFEYGTLQDKTLQARNGFSSSAGIDTQREPGYIQVSQALQAVTSSASMNTDYAYFGAKYTKDSACSYWKLNKDGKLCGKIGTAWRRIHTNSQTTSAGGLGVYNDTLFYASDGYLGKTVNSTITVALSATASTLEIQNNSNFPAVGDLVTESEIIRYTATSGSIFTGCTRGADGTTGATHSVGTVILGFYDTFKTFTAADTGWHPMKEYLAKLNVGDGRYVATLDSADTWSATDLTLPLDYRVSCLESYADKLTIGTYKGTYFYSSDDSQLFTWNGVDDLPEETFNLKEAGITSLIPWQNLLLVFSGIKGNIYQFNGAYLSLLKTIPGITYNNAGYVYPGSVGNTGGDVLMGVSGGGSTTKPGVYCLSKNENGIISIIHKYIPSCGINSTGDQIYGCLMPLGSGDLDFYVNLYDSSGGYIVNQLDNSNRVASAGFFETQIYEIPQKQNQRFIRGVELVAQDMTAGTVNIKYKADEASSWSTLGEIDSQNQDNVLFGIDQRAKNVQLRLEFECTSNYTPVIKTIKIY